MNKLLIIRQSTNTFGGVENQICTLAHTLHQHHIIEPILATSDKNSIFAKTFLNANLKVYETPISQRGVFDTAKQISSIIKNENITAIQTHMFRESIVGRLIKLQNPEIVHIFRPQTYIDCSWIPKWKKTTYHILDKITSPWVDKYVANGRYLAQEITERSWIEKTKIINVIDGVPPLGQFDSLENTDLPIPRRLAMVANFNKKKGHDTLIKALAILKEKNVIIQARLIGSGPKIEEIKLLAKDMNIHDQLEFCGFTNEVYNAVRDFPVIVLPSDSEGVPNSIMEAMSLKKIVVCSNTGGVTEIITNGIDGFTHNPGDSKGFADILENIFTNPASHWNLLRENAYNTWKNKFSFEKMIAAYIEIYNQLGLLKETSKHA